MTQSNYSFSPGSFTVKKGQTITVVNSTPATPHTFTISGHGVNVTVNPGQSSTVTINLPPGRYPFVCTFHVSLGMKGTLIVK